jgi:hypothetical protein
MNYNKKLDIAIFILSINLLIFTLLTILLQCNHKYYSWIVSIFVLNIQTILYCTFISWKFYKKQKIYKHYIISVIITSFLSGLMMWFHRTLATFDLLTVILILFAAQISSVCDIIIYKSVCETFIAYKKMV